MSLSRNKIDFSKIYVIGDSHSHFWAGASGFPAKKFIKLEHGINTPPPCNYKNIVDIQRKFQIYHIGPVLAYSLGLHNTTWRGTEKIEFLIDNNYLPLKCNLLLSFGEIDIRVHIFKSGYDKFMERLNKSINNYFKFIDYLNNKFNTMIYGPIATQKDKWWNNPEFPRSGTELQRNIASMIYNNLLARACEKRNIFFFTLFNDLIDNNLLTQEKYIADQCHLSDNIYEYAMNKFDTQLDRFIYQSNKFYDFYV